MTANDNLVQLLNDGISVEKKRVYFYKTGCNYKVLDLNKPTGEDEFHFGPNEFSEALDKFSELTDVK